VIVLGIDPGTAVMGFGVVRRGSNGGALTLVECGVVRTPARAPLGERLSDVYDGVRELLARHRPDAVVVEDVFYARNVRTTAVLGHARGVILLAVQQAGCPVHELAPAAIKKAVTGAGAATKEQVQYMVAQLLRLKKAPEPADAADGVAAALAIAMGAVVPALPRAELRVVR
jgi:crossover junction endodeoxyribonuclease RuvC